MRDMEAALFGSESEALERFPRCHPDAIRQKRLKLIKGGRAMFDSLGRLQPIRHRDDEPTKKPAAVKRNARRTAKACSRCGEVKGPITKHYRYAGWIGDVCRDCRAIEPAPSPRPAGMRKQACVTCGFKLPDKVFRRYAPGREWRVAQCRSCEQRTNRGI